MARGFEGDAANAYDGWDADPMADEYALLPMEEGFEDDAWHDAATQVRTTPLIIRGGATQLQPRVAKTKRPRRLTTQFFIIITTICVALSALLSAGYVAIAGGQDANPFDVLANVFVSGKSTGYFSYRTLPGDTFDSVAAKFSVQVNGIFELNNLTVDAAMFVGRVYKISTDPNYGANYIPPLPPGSNYAGYQTPQENIPSKNQFNFTAIAGYTNGPTGSCPQGWAGWNGNPALYHMINPDQPTSGKPSSHFTQRFSFVHSGIDISTGAANTPIYAAQAGTVIFATYDNGGGGLTLKISHCGWVATSYCHLVAGSVHLKIGDNVTQGQLIGLQGDTGDAVGYHLHYMVWWHNVPTDPVCAYPQGIDGITLSREGGAYNGCAPNLSHNSWP